MHPSFIQLLTFPFWSEMAAWLLRSPTQNTVREHLVCRMSYELIFAEYGKTLICNGLTVASILINPTSSTHNLLYIWSLHKRFFVLFPQKLSYDFWPKWTLSRYAKSKVFSNVRALQIFERKVLLSILNRKIFERNLLSLDKVATG